MKKGKVSDGDVPVANAQPAASVVEVGQAMSDKDVKDEIAQWGAYVLFVDVLHGSLNNGMDSRPRTFMRRGQQIAEVTGGAIKRCIRDTLDYERKGEKGFAIFVKSHQTLESVVQSVTGKETDEVKMADAMCENLVDARWFGGVFIKGEDDEGSGEGSDGKDGKKGKSSKSNATGPVNAEYAQSIHPVVVEEAEITRCCTQKNDKGKDSHNMATHYFLRYARFRCVIHVERPAAERTKFTVSDQKILEGALNDLYKYRKSAARPDVRTVAVFKVSPKNPVAFSNRKMSAVIDRIQCKQVDIDQTEDFEASSFSLPEPFETEDMVVTRIDE